MHSSGYRKARYGVLSVEVPILMLALGTLVLRVRATADLAENPLDPAGLFRLACVGGAGLLAFLSLLTPLRSGAASGNLLKSRLFLLYMIYVFVVFVGAPLSQQPLLTAYRGVELAIVFLVFAAAYRRVGDEAVGRIQGVLYWFLVAMLCTVWAGVALAPSLAVREVSQGFTDVTTPLPWQISGAFPTISANLVGALSALLIFWSIGRVIKKNDDLSARTGAIVSAFALVTLIGAQYRTGYIAVLFGGLLAVILLRKKAMAAFAIVIVIVGLATGLVSLGPAQDFVLKGQDTANTSATRLTGRLEWWEEALPVWRDSPVIGKGLLTATRFEVLSALGKDTGSTIHSTWVEALLGTGVVGTGLLFLVFGGAWVKAIRQGYRSRERIIPALLMAVLTVRSLTGSSFEIFSLAGLVFFWVLLFLQTPDEQPEEDSMAYAAPRVRELAGAYSG